MGDPVAHSLSPRMHNAAIAALGLDAVYVALRVGSDAFPALARGLLAAGAALNVTVPHKRRAAAILDAASDEVRRTGACNTVWAGVRGLEGDNTDVAAVRRAAARLMRGRPVRRTLLIGTGGSARAAAAGVADEWPDAAIAVRSRDGGRAAEFRSWAEGAGVRAAEADGDAWDLVVNATPLGLVASDPPPMELARLRSRPPSAVLDLVYARGRTRLVQAAREAGCDAEDGREVLVWQGAASFERFFDLPAPSEVMRAAVEEALGG